MQSKAATVDEYLASLPADRRETVSAVRRVILANLDQDYEEGMTYGMIGYYVPHRVYPAGYHCDPKQPLPFACLASQKNYISIYLMSVYADGSEGEQWFRSAWAKTGRKLNMGKCCVRFRRLEDVALDVVGEAIRRVPVEKHIETYERVIRDSRKRTTKRKPAAKKTAMSSANKKSPPSKAAAPKKAAAKTKKKAAR